MYCHCSAQAWIKKRWLFKDWVWTAWAANATELSVKFGARKSSRTDLANSWSPGVACGRGLCGDAGLCSGCCNSHTAFQWAQIFGRIVPLNQNLARFQSKPFAKVWCLISIFRHLRFMNLKDTLSTVYLHLSLELPWTLKCSLCLLAWPAKCAGSMAPKAPRTCPQSSWLPARRCSITASSSFISTCLGINAGSPIHTILILEIPEKGGKSQANTRSFGGDFYRIQAQKL